MKSYLTSWCTQGFECLEDISKYEHWDQEQLVNILADRKVQSNPLNSLVGQLRLRAQFNSQRHYEIYAFTVSDEVEHGEVKRLAKQDPQYLVDWIRSNGIKLYSDRNTQKPVII